MPSDYFCALYKCYLPHLSLTCARWHGVAIWKWSPDDEVCGICRNPFDACCPDCKVPGDDCPPGLGYDCCAWENCMFDTCNTSKNLASPFIVKTVSIYICLMCACVFVAVWSKCEHAFHMHCIVKWLQAQNVRQQCPMCRRDWEYRA